MSLTTIRHTQENTKIIAASQATSPHCQACADMEQDSRWSRQCAVWHSLLQ